MTSLNKDLQKVIKSAWQLRDDLRQNTKSVDEVRTEAVLLNTVNKAVQLHLQDQVIQNNLGFIQARQAKLLSLKEGDYNEEA